eukprot:533905_1
MYIMYFPKPNIKLNYWQWWDNNKCKYISYDDPNDILQLECSYLSNLYENYPKNMVKNHFTHCIFSTFMQRNNTTRDKLYVLKYSIIEELQNKVVVEQVAYTNNRNFPRVIRRIRWDELQKEEKNQSVPRMDIEYDNNECPTPIVKVNQPIVTLDINNINNNNSETQTLEGVIERFTHILITYQAWLCSLFHEKQTVGMLSKLVKIYNINDIKNGAKLAIIKLRNDFEFLKTEINKMEDTDNE